jgi:hypothetical protein
MNKDEEKKEARLGRYKYYSLFLHKVEMSRNVNVER